MEASRAKSQTFKTSLLSLPLSKGKSGSQPLQLFNYRPFLPSPPALRWAAGRGKGKPARPRPKLASLTCHPHCSAEREWGNPKESRQRNCLAMLPTLSFWGPEAGQKDWCGKAPTCLSHQGRWCEKQVGEDLRLLLCFPSLSTAPSPDQGDPGFRNTQEPFTQFYFSQAPGEKVYKCSVSWEKFSQK